MNDPTTLTPAMRAALLVAARNEAVLSSETIYVAGGKLPPHRRWYNAGKAVEACAARGLLAPLDGKAYLLTFAGLDALRSEVST